MLQDSENKREAKVKDLIKKTCGIFGQLYWVSGLLFVHSIGQCILLLLHKPLAGYLCDYLVFWT